MKQGRTVLEAKRFGCYTCYPDTSLLAAVQRMVNEDVSCLVVIDQQGYLAGIITRNDVLRGYLENDDWQPVQVGAYMTKDVITVQPDSRLQDVANLLLTQHIHRAVVVRDAAGRPKPVAVISATDLIYHMLKEAE